MYSFFESDATTAATGWFSAAATDANRHVRTAIWSTAHASTTSGAAARSSRPPTPRRAGRSRGAGQQAPEDRGAAHARGRVHGRVWCARHGHIQRSSAPGHRQARVEPQRSMRSAHTALHGTSGHNQEQAHGSVEHAHRQTKTPVGCKY
jgi:hypothetical protein